jgi:hypothetical protein
VASDAAVASNANRWNRAGIAAVARLNTVAGLRSALLTLATDSPGTLADVALGTSADGLCGTVLLVNCLALAVRADLSLPLQLFLFLLFFLVFLVFPLLFHMPFLVFL